MTTKFLAMRIVCILTVFFAGLSFGSPSTPRSVKFKWGSEKVRGVNIGGWLVLEPWITPSIFDGLNKKGCSGLVIDEWTLGHHCGEKEALPILQKHWDTWVSLADFQKIAQNGFNLVRIPIGYWAYKKFGDPYIPGAAPYIDRAIGWARKTGLKVMIDLHAMPGSCNGFDNGGRNGTVAFGTGDTVADAKAVVQLIANKYAQKQYQDVVVAIQVMNEPLPYSINGDADVVEQYYKDAYGNVRVVSDTPVVIHDGFQQGTFWNDVLQAPGVQGVIVDHHEYQVFTPELIGLSPEQHVHKVCSNSWFYASNVDHWVVVGEWTGAMTDCAPHLNGYRKGSRWEGSLNGLKSTGRKCGSINDVTKWSATTKANTRHYIEVQLDVFEQQTQGFIFWNFKTEGASEWDLFRLLDAGVFPNLKGRKPRSICSW